MLLTVRIIRYHLFSKGKKIGEYGPVRLEVVKVASVSDQLQRLNVVRLPVADSATDRSDQTLATRD